MVSETVYNLNNLPPVGEGPLLTDPSIKGRSLRPGIITDALEALPESSQNDYQRFFDSEAFHFLIAHLKKRLTFDSLAPSYLQGEIDPFVNSHVSYFHTLAHLKPNEYLLSPQETRFLYETMAAYDLLPKGAKKPSGLIVNENGFVYGATRYTLGAVSASNLSGWYSSEHVKEALFNEQGGDQRSAAMRKIAIKRGGPDFLIGVASPYLFRRIFVTTSNHPSTQKDAITMDHSTTDHRNITSALIFAAQDTFHRKK